MTNIRELQTSDLPSARAIFDLYWFDDFNDHLVARTKEFLENDSVLREQDFHFYIAEEDKEILGIVAYRKVPSRMFEYTNSEKPAELYVIAVREKGKGTGRLLMEKVSELTKNAGYTELVLYSGETHQESWRFYDHLNFKRVGESIAPNGERGQIWQIVL